MKSLSRLSVSRTSSYRSSTPWLYPYFHSVQFLRRYFSTLQITQANGGISLLPGLPLEHCNIGIGLISSTQFRAAHIRFIFNNDAIIPVSCSTTCIGTDNWKISPENNVCSYIIKPHNLTFPKPIVIFRSERISWSKNSNIVSTYTSSSCTVGNQLIWSF